ncbi:transposase family protein [Streptomyces sp. NBC_01216]|uniref:transposase family protein n=1 Tax=unclassified Streptomyces TaxID=2593676 RepID=UPI002E15F8C5|nr:hypothetical protein OG393_04045 [Streptomyces sp. NBC_01216]
MRQAVSGRGGALGRLRHVGTGCAAGRTHEPTSGQKEANRVLAVGRAPVEHGIARLKTWRILTELRTDPARATRLLRARLVLTNLESSVAPTA